MYLPSIRGELERGELHVDGDVVQIAATHHHDHMQSAVQRDRYLLQSQDQVVFTLSAHEYLLVMQHCSGSDVLSKLLSVRR